MTGQLSQSIQILTSSRGSINAMPATITSESSTSPVEFIMATVCKICAGPIEPPDQHYHCVACLGLAQPEVALDESDCGHCADLPGLVLRARRDMAYSGWGLLPPACAGGLLLSWWRERRLATPPDPMVAPFHGFLPRGLLPSSC